MIVPLGATPIFMGGTWSLCQSRPQGSQAGNGGSRAALRRREHPL